MEGWAISGLPGVVCRVLVDLNVCRRAGIAAGTELAHTADGGSPSCLNCEHAESPHASVKSLNDLSNLAEWIIALHAPGVFMSRHCGHTGVGLNRVDLWLVFLDCRTQTPRPKFKVADSRAS